MDPLDFNSTTILDTMLQPADFSSFLSQSTTAATTFVSNSCPCPPEYQQQQEQEEDYYGQVEELLVGYHHHQHYRLLQDNSTNTTGDGNGNGDAGRIEVQGETWQIIYTCFVLFFMMIALVSDRIGADCIMLSALTLFMAAQIITIKEGLTGFSNEGILTVLVLFVVADGISKTGALDWYMGKLLGKPKTLASAQLRLIIPIAIVSGFLNNTPVVAIMIPIVQRWGKNIGISPQQLLIPLSFASILGGTCTLIGTSTNLVVVGLLATRYPNDDALTISLFSLGQYGVPIAIIGTTYILLFAPILLPGAGGNASTSSGGNNSNKNAKMSPFDDDLLLGGRLTAWSPAAGRTVKRSGLRDTGGIYLVSVHRATTGNIHRAVGQEFVLNVGDVLYFTGLVEGFGEFCLEHGLEIVTNEVEQITGAETASTATKQQLEHNNIGTNNSVSSNTDNLEQNEVSWGGKEEAKDNDENEDDSLNIPATFTVKKNERLPTVDEDQENNASAIIPYEIGLTKESLRRADETERMQTITRMTDLIRGLPRDDPYFLTTSKNNKNELRTLKNKYAINEFLNESDPPKIVVTIEHNIAIIGVSCRDRAGLLLDISRGILRLNLQLHHTEAAVLAQRSLSIWRCEPIGVEIPDIEEIWSVLNALLESENGIEAVKKRGLKVIRARVTEYSTLIGRTAAEVDFRKTYEAAIVAIYKASEGKNVNKNLSIVRFEVNDVLILQASDNSPLLVTPPSDFYINLANEQRKSIKKSTSGTDLIGMKKVQSLVNLVTNFHRRTSSADYLIDADDTPGSAEKQPSEGLETGDGSSDMPRSQSFPSIHDDTTLQRPSPSMSGVASPNNYNDGDDFVVGSEIARGADDDEAALGDIDKGSNSETNNNEYGVWRDLQALTTEVGGDNVEKGVAREFLTAMTVAPSSKLANKTVAQAGINKLPGIVLVSIERPTLLPQEKDGKKVTPSDSSTTRKFMSTDAGSVSTNTIEQTFITLMPDEPLKEGDILWFAGSASDVGDLRKIPGLLSYQNDEVAKINEKVHDRRLVQAVIAKSGPLVGKTVKEARFRTRYGAAVIAVHRDGKRIYDHPGKVKLQSGDVLLLEAGSTFIAKNAENDRSFTLLAEVKDSAPPRLTLLIPALTITATMLAVYTFVDAASLLTCGLLASILMVFLGILSEQEARDAVNWDVYITIASAFGIGTAMVNSGVAGYLAKFLVYIGESMGIGDAGLFGAVYFATFLISNIVTNNAAAALLFPIAMDSAEATGVDRILMSYCLMLGASASFMSPFGYTTNLLIYGPGGYKYKDFLMIGTPMQIVLWISSVLLLSDNGAWWRTWVISIIVFAVVASFTIFNSVIRRKFASVFSSKDNETITRSDKDNNNQTVAHTAD